MSDTAPRLGDWQVKETAPDRFEYRAAVILEWACAQDANGVRGEEFPILDWSRWIGAVTTDDLVGAERVAKASAELTVAAVAKRTFRPGIVASGNVTDEEAS